DNQRCPMVAAGCMAERVQDLARQRDWPGPVGRTGSTAIIQRRQSHCGVRLLKLGGFCGLLCATGESSEGLRRQRVLALLLGGVACVFEKTIRRFVPTMRGACDGGSAQT